MSKPYYTKVIQGVVEQLYGEDGYCISQRFVAFDGAPVDRRYHNPGVNDDNCPEGDLPHDAIIEHPDDLEDLVSVEKHCDLDMVQPRPPKK